MLKVLRIMTLLLWSFIQVKDNIFISNIPIKVLTHWLVSVISDPRELDVVTLTLKSDPRSFTENELTTIRDQIALLLHQQGILDININIGDIIVEPNSGMSSMLR